MFDEASLSNRTFVRLVTRFCDTKAKETKIEPQNFQKYFRISEILRPVSPKWEEEPTSDTDRLSTCNRRLTHMHLSNRTFAWCREFSSERIPFLPHTEWGGSTITNSQTQNILEKADIKTCLSRSLEAVVPACCCYSHVNLTQRSALPCILPAILEVWDLVLPYSSTSWWQALVSAWNDIHLAEVFISASHSLCELYICFPTLGFRLSALSVWRVMLCTSSFCFGHGEYGSSIQLFVELTVFSLWVCVFYSWG